MTCCAPTPPNAPRLRKTRPRLTAALGRLLDHYVHTGNAADLLLGPARDPLVLTPPADGVVPEPIADAQQAAAWFDTECDALLAAAIAAAPAGFASHVWQLGWILSVYLERRAAGPTGSRCSEPRWPPPPT